MSRSEKLKSQWRARSTEIIGEPVHVASMVVPPGSSLYKSYAPSQKALALGGPLFEVLASKASKHQEGTVADIPRQMGFLAVTDSLLVFLKKKKLGTSPLEVLISWPIEEVMLTVEEYHKWDYPGLAIEFADGTGCVLMGEKQWPLAELAAAANQ